VVRFQLFANTRCFTGLSAPNMVLTGTFSKQLDRASLSKDPQAVVNRKFPGISINLRNIQGRGCTPGLHTRMPSKFIIPGTFGGLLYNRWDRTTDQAHGAGCRDVADICRAVNEINEIAGKHFVRHKRKPDQGEEASAGHGGPTASATPAKRARGATR